MNLNFDSTTFLRLGLLLPLFLFSLTLHEFAHAWTAVRFGDPTPEQDGRLTLDPRAHLDPLGTLMFLLSCLAGLGFGWAKPVQVRLGNCRNPNQAMLWVAAAGPLSNLLQSLVGVVLLLILGWLGAPSARALALGVEPIVRGDALALVSTVACVVGAFVQVNLVLMVFNLLPLPPLDGGRIVVARAPFAIARTVASWEPYGFLILFALMWVHAVDLWFQWTYLPLLTGLGHLFWSLGLR